MRVAFVGSNPSHSGPNSPAKQNLFKWVKFLQLEVGYSFYNVSERVTPGNRPLKKSEYDLERLRDQLRGCGKVVALGATAADALNKLGVAHFKLPHPSPKNRVLNDKLLIESTLRECRNYLEDEVC